MQNSFENPEHSSALEVKPFPTEQVSLKDQKINVLAIELKHTYKKVFELTENENEYILRTPEPGGVDSEIIISKSDPDAKGAIFAKIMSGPDEEYMGSIKLGEREEDI